MSVVMSGTSHINLMMDEGTELPKVRITLQEYTDKKYSGHLLDFGKLFRGHKSLYMDFSVPTRARST